MPVSTLIARRMMFPSMSVSLLQLLAGPDVAERDEEKQNRATDESQIEHRSYPFAARLAARRPVPPWYAARRLFNCVTITSARGESVS